MSLNWMVETLDGKIRKISSSFKDNVKLCAFGDKPRETSNQIDSPMENASLVSISSTLGINCITQLDRLIDCCLTKMVKGENSSFELECSKSKAKAIISLKLEDFEDRDELFETLPLELLEFAKLLKTDGVKLYTEKRIEDAFHKFSKSCKYLILIDHRDIDSTILEAKEKLLSNLLSNLAGCHVAHKNWNLAIYLCNRVLEKEPNNVKAYFRRGVSFLEIKEYDKAREDFLMVKKLEPNNTIAKNKLLILDEKEKLVNQKYATALKKMFN